MRIVSWNLGHRTREAAIPDAMGVAVASLRPDVLVLNEFVDGATRDGLRSTLCDIGLRHIQVSNRVGRNNQVLIASSTEPVAGELVGPELEGGAGASNFLHVRFPDGLEVVGLRAPTYTGPRRIDYWERLSANVSATRARRIAWIGDWNADPDRPRSRGGRYLAQLERDGWLIPRPTGPWSFWKGSRIDHVLISPAMQCIDAEYIVTIDGRAIAGPPSMRHVSDHAALAVTIVSGRDTP